MAYPLRSRTSCHLVKQATIEFPCRKRRRETNSKARSDENAIPKIKKAKPDPMPVTRSRAKSGGSNSTSPVKRQPLKQSNDVIATPPSNERTPSPINKRNVKRGVVKQLDFSPQTPVQRVKKSLHNSLPHNLLCRDDQMKYLREFLHEKLSKHNPGALYISGAPGTGKTACLTHLLENSGDLLSSVSVAMVNCMSVTGTQGVFSRLAEQLLGQRSSKGRGLEKALLTHITSAKNMIVVVLDEVDQLDSRTQEVLYTLFEWPSLPNSRLVLIGIANALDLTDRILPRLQSHTSCQPDLLHFPPFSREEIATILNQRLACDSSGTVVDPMAVQFCARKVAAVHGDLRKALDICRRAVELVESQQRLKHSPSPQPMRVTLSHVASVISDVYGSGVTPSNQDAFPLQQKLVLCTLLLMVRGRTVKELTLGKLHEAYVKVCKHKQLKNESECEFVGLCSMLETRGVVSIKKAKETRLMKVTLKLQESEVEHALQDRVLISSILALDHTLS